MQFAVESWIWYTFAIGIVVARLYVINTSRADADMMQRDRN